MGGWISYKQALKKYHSAVHDLFAAYGSFVATYPLIPLFFGVILLGSLCVGLLRAEKESNIENLWVEQNSRVVPEKKFFDSHFGGISRKESVAITSKKYPDENLKDLGLAMDALTSVVKPLYDDLVLNYSSIDGHDIIELTQTDFCERPFIPQTLKSGADPNIHGNWYAWGYRRIARCALDTIQAIFTSNLSAYHLPDDWGLDVVPCYKLSPMDCFREGKDFDYPKALQQLEQVVVINSTLNGTLNQVVVGFEMLLNNTCFKLLESALKSNPKSIGVTLNLSADEIDSILTGIKTVINVFAAWGYNWRPSYKSMTSEEIMDYISKAIDFSKNTSISLSNPAVQHCITENRPCCLTWFGGTVPVEASLGGVEYDAFGKISAISSVRWGENNWNQKHPLWMEYIAKKLNASLSDKNRENLVLDWERAMIDITAPLQANAAGTNFTSGGNYKDYQIQFTMWRSTEDILADANRVPLWQLILSAILVLAYAIACFINLRSPVHSHTWLVLMGLVVVSFAIVAGFGLTSACGIKLSPLAGSVVPFLALGLGIDDVFVLVNILRNCVAEEKVKAKDASNFVMPHDEMRFIVSLAGPSVVLTTFSVLASFFISSVSPMPVARWFCWQMGITAAIHTLGMLLIFIPLMSFDVRRVKAGIVDPCLWALFGMKRTKAGKTPPPEHKELDDSKILEQTARTPISDAVANFYVPLFNYKSFKISMVILFAGLLGATTYFGFWKVQHGLKLSDIALKGSYQHDFAALTEQSYPQYDLYLVTQNIRDYAADQAQLLQVYDRPQQNLSEFLPSPVKILDYTWLGNLYTSLNMSLGLSYPLAQQNFTQLVQSWTTSPLGILSLQDLYCQSKSTGQQLSCFVEQQREDWSIGATKTVVFANSVGSNTKNNVEMIKQTRKSLDEMNQLYFNGTKTVYMYGFPYLFNEQYLHSLRDLYTVVGFALVGVFLAVLIFQFSLTMSLIIAILLLMVDIEVYGFMYIVGAKLNALSLVNLGIVIGMASEFTYLARSFLLFDGTRTERVQKALEWTFEPLLHGLGTQVVATLPLVFLKFHAFRIYYFAMFTIMGVLGFLNGFVLLPIILSWIGPPSLVHFKKHAHSINGDDKESPLSSISGDNKQRTPPFDIQKESESSALV
eukprot:c21015_g1_i1 orf=984-4394(+)